MSTVKRESDATHAAAEHRGDSHSVVGLWRRSTPDLDSCVAYRCGHMEGADTVIMHRNPAVTLNHGIDSRGRA